MNCNIKQISCGILMDCENAVSDIFEDLYYENIMINKYIKSIKRRKTTLYEALTVFKDEALYWAMNNKYHDNAKNILKILNSKNNNEKEILKARETEIESILHNEGIKYYKCRAACPLCDSDNNTSLSFKENIFYCFKCQEKGDSITFIQKVKKISFIDSVKYLSTIN